MALGRSFSAAILVGRARILFYAHVPHPIPLCCPRVFCFLGRGGGVHVAGTIPRELGDLVALTVLDLHGNSFDGKRRRIWTNHENSYFLGCTRESALAGHY